MLNSYQLIVNRIDEFIRKYYSNLLLRGSLITALILLATFLLVISLEYAGHYSIQIRTTIFYSLISLYSLVFLVFFLRPLLWFLGINRKIGRKQAAFLLAESFPEIKDSLINMIELKELADSNADQNELILASIEQKTKLLNPIPFAKAVSYKSNVKWLAWFSVPAIILLLLLSFNPALVTSGTERIIKHRTFFEMPLPFSFLLQNDSLSIEKGQDFEIELLIRGNEIPDQVYLEHSGTRFLMNKLETSLFRFPLRSIYNDLSFSFYANGVKSQSYRLNVIPSPTILDFELEIIPPNYTGEAIANLQNVGDVSVPEGSRISWNIKTIDSEQLFFVTQDTTYSFSKENEHEYQYKNQFHQSVKYSLTAVNEFIRKENLLSYFIQVIPDVSPSIDVKQAQDTLNPLRFFFKGSIGDDYGFSQLRFIIEKNQTIDSIIKIPFYPDILNQEFYYAFNFSNLNFSSSENLSYYFEVSDNDQINGYKTVRSREFSFYVPGKNELNELADKSADKMDEILRESAKMSEKIKQELDDFKKKSVTEDLTSWEKTQMIDNLLNQQEALQKMVEQLEQENALKNQMENSFEPLSDELLEKQKELEELMQKLFDDELKDLLNQLREMQDKLDDKEFNQLAEDLNFSMEDMKNRLDQSLEQLRKFEIEKKLEKSIEDLNKLSEEQQNLSDEINNSGISEEKIQENKDQKERFDKLMEEYQKTLDKNKELKRPMDLDDMKKDAQDIKSQFQESKTNMDKGNQDKSSDSAGKNSKKIKKMADNLDLKMKSNKKKKKGEDIENLRQIMENLIKFSFNQEDLLTGIQSVQEFNPKINDIVINQNKINNDFTIIKDSLDALVIRNPQAGNGINQDLLTVRKKMALLVDAFEQSNLGVVAREQQYIMTSANNLALLLSETLDNMMQEMNSMGGKSDGDDSCEKPGSKSDGFEGMKEMQEGLKEQIQKMLEQMQKGQGQGDKPGDSGMNRQIAQMMAQQEIFRDMLNKMQGEKGLTQETQEILKEINRLAEESEKDMVNRKVNREMLKRQEQILTRLLEAEESENKREVEEKREAKENKLDEISSPENYFLQKKEWEGVKELIQYQDIKLNNYYRQRYSKYLQLLNNK